MAVLVTNSTSASLSSANIFYTVGDSNLTSFSATTLALTSTRTITLSGFTAGNFIGLVICVQGSSGVDRSIQALLKLGGVTQETVTLTATQIKDSATNGAAIFQPLFTFNTAFAAGTWTIDISQTGGTTGNWNLKTSNGTAPFYIAWSDNTTASYAANDCIFIRNGHTLTIDQSFTVQGIYGTGETSFAPALLVGQTGTLVWSNPPAASYTLTVALPASGTGASVILVGYHGTFRIGTSANKIASSVKAIINFNGNAARGSGFYSFRGYLTTTSPDGNYLFLYGESRAIRQVTLNGDVAIGATSLTSNETPTGWLNSDVIYLTKADVIGSFTPPAHTISSIAGNTINFSPATATRVRKSGGHVINSTGYGIEINGVTQPFNIGFGLASKFEIDGCLLNSIRSIQNDTSPPSTTLSVYDDSANTSQHFIKNCFFSVANGANNFYVVPAKGLLFDNNDILVNSQDFFGGMAQSPISGALSLTNNRFFGLGAGKVFKSNSTLLMPTYSGNYFYNVTANYSTTGINSTIDINGTSFVFSNNVFWGMGIGIRFVTVFSMTGTGNKFNKCTTAILLDQVAIRVVLNNSVFGNETVNTYDIDARYDFCLLDFQFNSTNASLIIGPNIPSFFNILSILKIVSNAGIAENDLCVFSYGQLQKTGGSLADTTTRLGSGYAWKLTPTQTNGTDLFTWPGSDNTNKQVIPSGNLQNKSPAVGIWVKINNAAYYAGTHTKPTLVVNYDNGTTVEVAATATTSWQRLAVSFTPLTTYGQYSWYLKAATDATGTNRDFYVDDFQNTYPNATVELGGLDLSANGEPVFPPVALNIISSAVGWDQRAADFNTDGTFGNFVNRILQILRRKI